MPDAAWPLLLFGVALFLIPMVRLASKLQRDPFSLFGIVFVALAVLLAIAVTHHGWEPLEDLQPCPSGTNLAGCPNYVAPHLPGEDPIPASQRVPTFQPKPSWGDHP